MTPLTRAEQAVLGAVLLDPTQLVALGEWLRPAHFYHPEHAALYQALLEARAHGHPGAVAMAGEVPVEWVTDAVAAARRTARGVTAAQVFHLPSLCPRPGHAPVYGRMVLEGAIHRKVTEHAARLHQAARADAARTSSSEDTRHYTVVLEGTLRDLAKAWGTDPKATPPPAGLADVPLKPLSASPERHADEEWLLSCLTADPSGNHGVYDWLTPGDFTDPEHQQIYHCLTALHHRGEPIDEVTALWEAQRRGYLTDGANGGLDADRVSRICGALGIGGSAAYQGERVMQGAFVRAADRAAQQIRHLAQRPLPPGKLISHALHVLQSVEDVRDRWQDALSQQPHRLGVAGTGVREPSRELAAAARARSPRCSAPSRASSAPALPSPTASVHPEPSRRPAP